MVALRAPSGRSVEDRVSDVWAGVGPPRVGNASDVTTLALLRLFPAPPMSLRLRQFGP